MRRHLRKIARRINLLASAPKGIVLFLLDSFSYFFRLVHIAGMPVNATIELTNICNQKCPVCETGAGTLKRKKGHLSFDNYKVIIDKIAPFINTVLLYYMGEPFLNKDIYEIIAYTKAKRIFVKICTNGVELDPVKVLDSGLDEIQFQIGGIRQETHELYRKGSDLSGILGNLGKLTAEKKKRRLSGENVATKIYLGLIVMKHNEREIEGFLQLASSLGVDGVRTEAPCVRDMEQADAFLPRDKRYWLYDIDSFYRGVLKHKDYKPNHCRWIYYSITVTWEGDVIPCCRDVNALYPMGNLLRGDMCDIWNGKKFKDFRKVILTDPKPLPMCLLCDGLSFPSMEKI